MNQNAVTLANDAGQSQTYTWWSDMPNQPTTPTIQMVNFKSTYKPYLIRRPGATAVSFGPSGYIDPGFPYWDHWPVCQLPNDGREAPRTDRPAHTSLSWFCRAADLVLRHLLHVDVYVWPDYTELPLSLATQSKAWNSPASLTLNSGDFTSQGFLTTQKAWQLTSEPPGNPSDLHVHPQRQHVDSHPEPGHRHSGLGGHSPELSASTASPPRAAPTAGWASTTA